MARFRLSSFNYLLTPAADKSVTLYVRQFWSTARNSKVPELLTSCRQLPRGWLDDAENPNSIAQCPSDSLSTVKDDVDHGARWVVPG